MVTGAQMTALYRVDWIYDTFYVEVLEALTSAAHFIYLVLLGHL